MTASLSDNQESTPESESAPIPKPGSKELPSIFDILLYSVTLTKRHANDVYGFTGYLLLPLILFFGVQGIPGTLGDTAVTVVNVLSIILSLWVAACICTLVSLKTSNPKKEHDPRSISAHAMSILGILCTAVLLSSVIQLAGYLLIIPGILATILLTFTFEEVVLRGHGPISALAASKARVQHQILGIGWRLLGIVLAFLLVYTTVSTGILLLGAWATGTAATVFVQHTPLWIDAILTVIELVFIPPVIIAHTVLYLASSPEKE